ncbi:MAG: hypothetical protein R3C15_14605 [Thermoleophilia bacterium]
MNVSSLSQSLFGPQGLLAAGAGRPAARPPGPPPLDLDTPAQRLGVLVDDLQVRARPASSSPSSPPRAASATTSSTPPS